MNIWKWFNLFFLSSSSISGNSIYGFIPVKACGPILIIPGSVLETPSLPVVRSRINLWPYLDIPWNQNLLLSYSEPAKQHISTWLPLCKSTHMNRYLLQSEYKALIFSLPLSSFHQSSMDLCSNWLVCCFGINTIHHTWPTISDLLGYLLLNVFKLFPKLYFPLKKWLFIFLMYWILCMHGSKICSTNSCS